MFTKEFLKKNRTNSIIKVEKTNANDSVVCNQGNSSGRKCPYNYKQNKP